MRSTNLEISKKEGYGYTAILNWRMTTSEWKVVKRNQYIERILKNL